MRSLLLALAVAALSLAAAQTVDIGPLKSDAKCTATASRTETLPFIGLSATDSARQCLTTSLPASTKPGEVVQRFTLDLTGLENKAPQEHRMRFAIWNHKRKVSGSLRTTVTIGNAPMGGQTARAVATVDASGRVTEITITNPGWGYGTSTTCSISANGGTIITTAICTAVVSGGRVTHALVAAPGKGYPPSVGSDQWVDPRAQLVYTTYDSATGQPSVTRTNLLPVSTFLGNIKDRTRCDCSDPTAAVCACVPAGYVSALIELPLTGTQCQGEMSIEIEAPVASELAIAAFYVRSSFGALDYPVIPMGQPTRVFERIGSSSSTTYRIGPDANGTDPRHTYLKELRLTMDTPMSANWRCTSNYNYDRDCAFQDGRIANITLDLSAFPFYHTPPNVDIGPPRKGIASVTVTDGGPSYTTRPSVTMVRATTQAVGSIQVVSGGKGYVRPPRVAFIGGSGSGATGTATIANGVVTGITVNTAGTNYATAPDVYLYSELEVTAIDVGNAGSGYVSASPPGVVISAPSAARTTTRQARAAAVVDANGRVASITVTEPGYGYESVPSVWLGPRVLSVTVQNRGSGYTTAPTVTFNGAGCIGPASAIAFATATLVDDEVDTIVVDQQDYQVCPGVVTVTIEPPGTGTPATGIVTMTPGAGATLRSVPLRTRWLHDVTAIALARLSPDLSDSPRDAVLRAVLEREDECDFGGKVVRVDIIDPGSDYTTDDIISISGGATATFTVEPAGTQATATATIDGNKLVNTVTVTQAGSGYNAGSPPKVTFVPLGRVHSIKITNQGSGYTDAPIVTIDNNAYGEARATATIANGRVSAITVTDPGAWYTSAPTVTITPRNEIRSIRLINPGTGYNPVSPPEVQIISTSGTGTGAKAVAVVGSNGCLTGITVTAGGFGYTSGTTSVSISGAATATPVIGGGSGATATAIVDNGEAAEAEATVNTAGAVSGITVTKKGRTFGVNGLPVPTISLTPALSGATLAMELNPAGVPTGRVIIKGTPTTPYGSAPTVSISSPNYGITGRAFLGAGLVSFLGGFTFPTSATYTPSVKTFSYAHLRASSFSSYFTLSNTAPANAGWTFFPNEDFTANNAFGADNPFNALMVPVTIKVEGIPYPELYQKGAVAGTVKTGGEPLVFQVSVPRDWSRVKLSYNITGGGDPRSTLSFKTMWLTTGYGYLGTQCGSNSWCTAISNPENAVYRQRTAQADLTYNPNSLNPPLLVEVSAGQCLGSPSGELSFSLVAEVTEYATEGECNSHFDCQNKPGISYHPTPGSRAGLSANGNSARFDKCVTDARPASLHKGICVECKTDCDCPVRQYCHLDNEYGTEGSLEKWGTCQHKDPVGDILGQPCRDLSSVVEFGQPGRNTQQYCGKVLFYNDSHVDPTLVNNGRGELRATLWTGYCHNHVCRECTSEGSSSGTGGCNTRRVCVDGFWQEKSGNSAQGAYAMAQTKTVKDAVNDGNAISGSVLAFVILIAVGAGLAIFFVVRKRA